MSSLESEDLRTLKKLGLNVAALVGVAVVLITASLLIG